MFEKDSAVKIHIRNLQLLMTEIFKTQYSLNPTFMKDMIVSKSNQYALRNEHLIKLLTTLTTNFGEKASQIAVEEMSDHKCRTQHHCYH